MTLVLTPAYGILAIFFTALPVTAALWMVSRNLALLRVASTRGYVTPHTTTPELMQRWNFSVTAPLAGGVPGTIP